MPSAGLSAHCCVYLFYFHHLQTHEELTGHFTSSLLHVCPLLILFWIHRSSSCHYFLFLVRSEVFVPCCVQISSEPHQSSSTPIFQRSRSAGLVRLAAFTLTQTNSTNRANTTGFVLMEPNMTSVNTPLIQPETGFHSPLTDFCSCFKQTRLVLLNFSENKIFILHLQ